MFYLRAMFYLSLSNIYKFLLISFAQIISTLSTRVLINATLVAGLFKLESKNLTGFKAILWTSTIAIALLHRSSRTKLGASFQFIIHFT